MSSFKLNKNQNEYLLAQLVLQSKTKDDVSNAPKVSDEDLIRLLENQLDAPEKKHVLNAISSSTDVYQRWIRLLETHVVLGEHNSQSQKLSASQSVVNTFQRWIQKLFEAPRYAIGGSFATACALLIIIVLLPKENIDPYEAIDQLYAESETILLTQWKNTVPKPDFVKRKSGSRSFFSKFKTKTDTLLLIERGFIEGANKLNPTLYESFGFNLSDLEKDLKQEYKTLDPQQQKVLYQIGKLMAYTTLQCQIPRTKAINITQAAAKALVRSATRSNIPDITKLFSGLNEDQTNEQSICQFTSSLLKHF